MRQSRYLAEAIGSNEFAELDLYLRHSRLRMPVLEVLGTDALRVSIAERVAKKLPTPENERDRGALGTNDMFLLTYLYCLNDNVEKAETLITDNAANIKKDEFAGWLWKKLQADFGFHPPMN